MATRNRYAEIMAQYAQSQPFSFTGIPSTYTGGFTGYPSDYTGGFNQYQLSRYVPPPPVQQDQYAEIIRQLGGGGGDADREAPSALSQMTPAERAAYYAANPTEGKIALGMQDLFGNATFLGNAAKYFGADGWYDSRLEKMGVNPTISLENQNTLAGTSFQNALNALNPNDGFVSTPDTQAVQSAINNTDFSGMDRGGGGDSGGRYGGDNSGDNAGWGSRDAGGDGFAQGGHVSMQRLQGPNPEGPDDGYAALKDGEFVINDKAVKKYGIELMQAINSGKISKGKLRGLLEM